MKGCHVEKLKGLKRQNLNQWLRVTGMQSGSYKNFLTVVKNQNEPLSGCSHWLQGSMAPEHGAATPSLPLRFMSKRLFPYSHWVRCETNVTAFPKAVDLIQRPKPRGINEMYSAWPNIMERLVHSMWFIHVSYICIHSKCDKVLSKVLSNF